MPLRGSSYLPLPPKSKNLKKGLINIKNEKGNDCFRWCHLAFLFSFERNRTNFKILRARGKSNYMGIEFTVKWKDLPKIENMNNVRFNAFGAK